MYIAKFRITFSDYPNPSEDNYLALKILTAHATLQKTKELKRLQAIKRMLHLTGGGLRLPNLQDHFSEKSHHGKHLCFGLSVLGPSIEDLRLSLPTKTLPVHVVQKVVRSILQALGDLHHNRIIHCGPYITHLFLQNFHIRNLHISLFNVAVILDNIRIYVAQRKVDLDPLIPTLPPCTIERRVTVDGVEYPIVRSQPIPHDLDLDDHHMDTIFYLNNLGHGTLWSSFRSFD